VLYWVKLAGAQTGYGVVLHSYSPAASRDVAPLLALLRIQNPQREGDDIVIPVQLSVGSPAPGAIVIETRSVIDLMCLAAASIELPADTPGATQFPAPGPAGQGINIRSSSGEPAQPRVATRYRDRWYYIVDDDHASKQGFNMLQLLASAQLSDAAAGSVPVLTIPVTGRR
jgi:hypothetical protein